MIFASYASHLQWIAYNTST